MTFRPLDGAPHAGTLLGVPARWAMAVLGATLLLICVSFALLLWTTREAERQKASVAAANLSAALTQDIARNLELYDLSIQGVLAGLADPAVMASPPAIRNRVLFDRSATAPYLGSIVVDDENGDVLYDSASLAPRRFNYADREFFRAHRARADLGLYVTAPYLSRTDHDWVVNLSRRVNKPDGSFGGVVAGTLRLDYLHRAFSRLRLGPGGSLTLFRTDGTVMMREPYDPALLGQVRHPEKVFDLLAEAPEGEYEARSVVDGVERLYHYERVGTLPLVQNVALSLKDVYADWWHKALGVSAMLLVACLIIIGLALMLRHELARRVRAEAALVAMAQEDALTGLANRRCFDEVLAAELGRASRHGWPLALLLVDADHFKRFNDAHGHVAGDAALVALAGCLARRAGRSGDLAARFGGEEFALILPHTDESEAMRVAGALREDVLSLAISPGAAPAHLSVSIGVAIARPREMRLMLDLVKEADVALYRSKAAGRNRATLADAVDQQVASERLAG